ncbi:hypothetical protein JJD41_22210 [Oxynema sp. CENA135]|uniref:hypothetical protein n=1 Tax=Oxynema sp. CENA135 TaxID=984206 RepID=UPI00190B46D5|nr:hypothetical protein [Oxynema sp. CENA135]MBK4732558.1 hypothetical protein [Oxynema sp. CENA135]
MVKSIKNDRKFNIFVVGAAGYKGRPDRRDRRDSRNSLENMTLLGAIVKKTTAIGGCDRTVFPIS